MEPRFQLRCLGGPVLSGPDGQPVRSKVRKHLALLVYLAVESKTKHRREHLADLLWPNLPEVEGRHSLATALSVLRAQFGRDVVESGRDDVRWAYTRLDLDLNRLEAGNVLGDEFTPPLDVAGFLDGFEVPGASEFMLWRERQRARWLPLVRDALVVLIDRCRRTGDSRQIEQLADRMLALDELSEEAVRAKMEARAFAGDRLTALKIFEAWRERLQEELGASPSSLLEGMALRLRKRGWERSGTSHIPSVRTEQWKDRPFVGRANEYRALYEGWERTQRGEPGHGLVLGESGIGKSTLVARLITAAGLEGASISRVQCYDLEREIPYAVIGGLVHGLLDRPGASGTTPEALGELARTLPEVRRKFPNIPAAGESEGESARLRLAEALHQLVLAVAEEHPLILVVDDHHLADDASLAVLHLLMRRSETESLMVILVARPSEMGRSPQAVRLIESLPRLGAATVELPPLTEIESDELLISLVPPDELQPSSAIRRALVRAAHGFPMVVELLCSDWRQHGEQSLALALDAITPDPAQSGAPTEAYRQLYDRIVRSLDPVTRNVLNLASILNHRLNEVGMYALADLTLGQTMLGMSQLTSLRVLRDGGEGLEFVNELIRAHAYMSMPASIRRVLHSNIADRLFTIEREGAEVEGLEVAWHCVRSGRVKEAAPYLLKGAQQATQRGGPQEAERALSTGLPILHGDARQQGIILLAVALQEQGQWVASLRLLDDADGEFNEQHRDRVFAMRARAQYYTGMIGPDNVGDVLDRLLRSTSVNSSSYVGLMALRVAALIAYSEKLVEPARSLLTIAESAAPDPSDVSATLELLYSQALLLSFLGEHNRSLEALTSGLAIIERNGISNSLANSIRSGFGAVNCSQGRYEIAFENFVTAYQAIKRLGADDSLGRTAGNIAICLGGLGRYREQVDWANAGLAHLGARFVGYPVFQLTASLAKGLAMSARAPEAIDAINAFDQRYPSSVANWIDQYWRLSKADVFMLTGKASAAKVEAATALHGRHYELHADGKAGGFARWIAVTATTQQLSEAFQRLDELRARLDTYDLLDQIEILAALRLLRQRGGKTYKSMDVLRDDKLLLEKAMMTPAPALQLIARLGLPV